MATRDQYDIAVIGGGFFGLSMAAFLARQGNTTVVFERGADLMQRASYVNQARVHNGYHYPRSILTALRSRINYPRFRKDYGPCIFDTFEKYYAVARRFTKVSGRQFQLFMERIGAPIELAPPHIQRLFDQNHIETVYKVEECAFDPVILKELAYQRLQAAGGHIHLDTCVTRIEDLKNGRLAVNFSGPGFEDRIVAGQVLNCTYAMINSVLNASGLPPIPLKHEITEMALIEPPEEIAGLGITVMCGPFFSTMPFPPRKLHTLSHVRYTPHCSWQDGPGHYRDAYATFEAYPKVSNYQYMVKDAARYLPCLQEARYIDSLWEVKTVLPLSEKDDSRPILFKAHWGLPNLICIMGGKIDNIYDAIEEYQHLTWPPPYGNDKS